MSAKATPGTSDPQLHGSFPLGSVIIPAHNEATVIQRTLRPLAPLAADGSLEIVVACNGCTDESAALARAFVGVRVLEIPEPSKVLALNAADAVARKWPRLYLDADVEIDPEALRKVFEKLKSGEVLAARPAYSYDTAGASRLVRSFYRARSRLPSIYRALWGTGAFALTEQGHQRFGQFPLISPRFSGDDLFVDHQFEASEKAVLKTTPLTVRTPRRAKALLVTLRRNYRSQAELKDFSTTANTTRELISSMRSCRAALDACIYAGFVVLARLRRKQIPGKGNVWERDESSRIRL